MLRPAISATVNGVALEVVQADITRLAVDGIVNAARSALLGGGGDDLLASCFQLSLAVAAEHGIRSIAFPAISTGIYGFPAERAAGIAVRTVAEAARPEAHETVVFCCFGEASTRLH